MSASNEPVNAAQIELWNGRVGEKWAEMQVNLDAMLAHVTAELKARAGSVEKLQVLDIGCGTGETLAIWLAGGAVATGVDVSAPMLAVAAQRVGGRASLIKADAAQWRAEAQFDLAVSKFGLMFFADREAAFRNIAENIKPGGRLLFACWRPLQENAWVTLPMAAIADLLAPGAAVAPDAPGPFALADKDWLGGMLERAGFEDITIQPFDFPVVLAAQGGAPVAVRMATQIGPTASALTGVGREVFDTARQRLRAIMAEHEQAGVVALGGAIWIVDAKRLGDRGAD